MKATDIFTQEEIQLIKLICKIFGGKVVSLGETRGETITQETSKLCS